MLAQPVRVFLGSWSLAVMALAILGTGSPAGDGPKVRSKASAEASRGQTTRYEPTEPESPPSWESGSFFGVRGRGKVFVFVIDCSGSMGDGRLVRAKMELRRSIARLRFPQSFLVVFYNDRPWVMPSGVPRSADVGSRLDLDRWLRRIDAEGATDPRAAMSLALGLRPDTIFLLSDGEFPRGTVEEIAARNTVRVPIHCIDLGNGAGSEPLRRIAEQSGGQYVER
jgi:hypothetical protein